MKKRSQIAVEYMLIIAIALVIIIPGIYLFRNYALNSNDTILQRRLNEISSQMLGKARRVYYYGPPSKSIVTIDMPPSVNNMYTFTIPNKEYHLVFEVASSSGSKEYFFESDVPIKAGDTIACGNVNPQCSSNLCECFPKRYFSKGIKNYKVEASEICQSEVSCIIMTEDS